jgi:hypothetical protein
MTMNVDNAITANVKAKMAQFWKVQQDVRQQILLLELELLSGPINDARSVSSSRLCGSRFLKEDIERY